MKALTQIAGVALVFIYAIGSGIWVNTGDNWYRDLNAPSWQPPDFIFGIIWPYNFVVLGIAAVVVGQRLNTATTLTFLLALTASIACALAWAYQFYRPHNLQSASIALAAAAILTIPLLIITFKASTPVALALIPYQAWMITAATLSYSYSKLN